MCQMFRGLNLESSLIIILYVIHSRYLELIQQFHFFWRGDVGLNSVINDTIFFLLDCTGLWFSHHGSDPDVWTHFGRTFQSCRFLGAAGQFPDYHFSSCLLCTGSNRRCCSGSHALKRVS